MRPLLLCSLLLAAALLAGCAGPEETVLVDDPTEPCGALTPAFEVDERNSPIVVLNTGKGDVRVAVYQQQVPVTAGTFLGRVLEGFYDGTRFHQLEPGVFIQGGDPLTASDNKQFWGTGGSGQNLPDEFHQYLRHDAPGMVSMASPGPNKGDSQFLIHLQPRPELDDQLSVFGRVVEGLDVVRNLSETPRDERGRPQFNAQLFGAIIENPQRDPRDATVAPSLFGYDCVQGAEPGGQAEFLVALRNTGQRTLKAEITQDLPEGWAFAIRNANITVVPSGQTVAYILDVDVPEDTPYGTVQTFNLTVADTESPAQTSIEMRINVGPLGHDPKPGAQVKVDYIGVLEDGRPFDTTIQTYTGRQSLGWFRDPPTHLQPLGFELGSPQLIQGYNALVDRAKLGQSVVGAIPAEQGYGDDAFGNNNLGGRLLIFQLQLVEAGGS